MTWTQNDAPLGSLFLSALVAALPVAALLAALALFHVKAHRAAAMGLALALAIAMGVYRMPPGMACAAALYGAAFGLLPIGWIVLNAVFVYDLAVRTGEFEVAKRAIAGLASDRRLQVLLIAYAFGAFLEGAAGLGAPVAISAAMLIGLGFEPLVAATLALIGNTAPVAYGGLGTPIVTLAQVTGLPELQLSAMTGRQLPFFAFLVPFWLIWTLAGFRGMRGVWPACLVAGLAAAIPQWLISNLFGPALAGIASGGFSMLALYALLKVWQPKALWRFRGDGQGSLAAERSPNPAETFRAWAPWGILAAFVFVWSLPPVKRWLDGVFSPNLPVPFLHQRVQRGAPVGTPGAPEAAIFSLSLLSATGTGLLLSGITSGLLLGLRPAALVRTYLGTLRRLRSSLLTIATMMALGFTTRYSGSDSTLGLALASTGAFFPFFSPLVGWLGVALTGSDASSNVLFGNLQVVTAHQVGMSPILAAAANSTGGVMGKMIGAQSLMVASVATGQEGREGHLLRRVFWHSVALVCLAGLMVLLQAYVFPGMIPR